MYSVCNRLLRQRKLLAFKNLLNFNLNEKYSIKKQRKNSNKNLILESNTGYLKQQPRYHVAAC